MKSKITFKTIGIISCVALLTVALAGCDNTAVAEPTSASEASQPISEPAASVSAPTSTDVSSQISTSTNENYIGEAEAKSIALAHAELNEADVSHMLCKLDHDDGIAEYEVEFWDGTTEYDYEINAVSGEITSYDYDMESYDDAPPATASDASASAEYIGETEATAIALAHAGVTESEAGPIKCQFDFDDGHAEYEVEWVIDRTEYEYTISATDGTIWEHDVDYNN